MASKKSLADVIWFNDSKGFGYAKDSSGNYIFIHYSAIEAEGTRKKSLSANEKLEVIAEKDTDKNELRATSVRILNEK